MYITKLECYWAEEVILYWSGKMQLILDSVGVSLTMHPRKYDACIQAEFSTSLQLLYLTNLNTATHKCM